MPLIEAYVFLKYSLLYSAKFSPFHLKLLQIETAFLVYTDSNLLINSICKNFENEISGCIQKTSECDMSERKCYFE